MSPGCEQRLWLTGAPCRNAAIWVVGVGSRKTDRQRSCGRCLSRTCRAMRFAEGRDKVALTVTSVKDEP